MHFSSFIAHVEMGAPGVVIPPCCRYFDLSSCRAMWVKRDEEKQESAEMDTIGQRMNSPNLLAGWNLLVVIDSAQHGGDPPNTTTLQSVSLLLILC